VCVCEREREREKERERGRERKRERESSQNTSAAATRRPLCDMTRSYMWGMSLSCVRHVASKCAWCKLEDHWATWLIHTCGAWLITYVCACGSHSKTLVRHDSFSICGVWLITYVCACSSHSKNRVRHDSFIHVGHDSLHTCVIAVATRRPVCDMTR